MSTDWVLPAVFLAGFFGGTHCIGMCGAVVVLFEHESKVTLRPWIRRLIYNFGRLLFYMLLGLVAGAIGEALVAEAESRAALTILRGLAGLLVIAIGLNLIFDWKVTGFLEAAGAIIWKRMSALSRYVLPVNTPARALGAGFVWGALPCGLVYSAVAVAATSGDSFAGALTMFAFWAGTLPTLLFAGASAAKLNAWRSRPVFRQVAGVLMIGLGLLSFRPLLHIGH